MVFLVSGQAFFRVVVFLLPVLFRLILKYLRICHEFQVLSYRHLLKPMESFPYSFRRWAEQRMRASSLFDKAVLLN